MNISIFDTLLANGELSEENVRKVKDCVKCGGNIFVIAKDNKVALNILNGLIDISKSYGVDSIKTFCKDNLHFISYDFIDTCIKSTVNTLVIDRLNSFVTDIQEKEAIKTALNKTKMQVFASIQLPDGASTNEGNCSFNLKSYLNILGVTHYLNTNKVLIIQLDNVDGTQKMYVVEAGSDKSCKRDNNPYMGQLTSRARGLSCISNILNNSDGVSDDDEIDYSLPLENQILSTVKPKVKYIGSGLTKTIKNKRGEDKTVTIKTGDKFELVTIVKNYKVSLGVEDEDGDIVWESDSTEFNKHFAVLDRRADLYDCDEVTVYNSVRAGSSKEIVDRVKAMYGLVRKEPLSADEIDLVRTCYACPEQYDAYDKFGNEIAYLRLRWGYFRVECPFGGEIVYSAETEGDGMFEDAERDYHLDKAKEAIADYYNKNNTIENRD